MSLCKTNDSLLRLIFEKSFKLVILVLVASAFVLRTESPNT